MIDKCALEFPAKMTIFAVLKKLKMNFLKDTKVYSIFTGTCPVCHKGKMYVEPNPFKISKIMEMHENCSHCGQKYKIEPSFFFGAMYVSYGLGVAVAIATFFIAYFFIGLDRDVTFIAIIVALIVLFPPIVRLSRNIWINLFIDFDKKRVN